ncbi:hypothetical protein J6590_045319 [Homalodisca vitripennis]|nr:hypothetical protein J6590_045319 [Homalodisca vitripennis]
MTRALRNREEAHLGNLHFTSLQYHWTLVSHVHVPYPKRGVRSAIVVSAPRCDIVITHDIMTRALRNSEEAHLGNLHFTSGQYHWTLVSHVHVPYPKRGVRSAM